MNVRTLDEEEVPELLVIEEDGRTGKRGPE